jgi:D-alanine-D-alanine ligase
MMTKVCVLAGGLSHERDVSIRSGRRVAEALRAEGISVLVRDVDAQLVPGLLSDPPDCVIPMLHGAVGEDGSLRDVLESLLIPFVGTRAPASRVAFDKMIAKTEVSAVGIATPDAVALPHQTFRDLGAKPVLEALVRRIGLPLVVKPTRGGSSLGVTVVREASALPAAMVGCFAYGDTAMLEGFVPGTEVAVSVIEGGEGPYALPAVEICPDSGTYDFASRYTAGTTEFFAPARLPGAVAADCARVAVLAHQALGLRHLSRVDMIIDETGVPQFLEVNVAPGCTETSLLPQAIDAAGLGLGSTLVALAQDACGLR